jgi:tRNA (guanine-N7-)-methyltransferase
MFDVPSTPDHMEWSEYYPNKGDREVEFVDVGCGFGGFLIKLGELYPETLSLGFEIRDKVGEYVRERIKTLRSETEDGFRNVACIRCNCQKDLPHYFKKHQLKKVFFLFPDPHFKAANHRRRIISTTLLDEYAYFMASGGTLYTITDVEELGQWMKDHLDRHPLFERIPDEELESDPAAKFLPSASEEAQKVARNCGKTFRAVYRRL